VTSLGFRVHLHNRLEVVALGIIMIRVLASQRLPQQAGEVEGIASCLDELCKWGE